MPVESSWVTHSYKRESRNGFLAPSTMWHYSTNTAAPSPCPRKQALRRYGMGSHPGLGHPRLQQGEKQLSAVYKAPSLWTASTPPSLFLHLWNGITFSPKGSFEYERNEIYVLWKGICGINFLSFEINKRKHRNSSSVISKVSFRSEVMQPEVNFLWDS